MSSKAPEAGVKPRAVYPAHEESDVVLKSGSTLRLRPVRPEGRGRAAGLLQAPLAGQPVLPLLLDPEARHQEGRERLRGGLRGHLRTGGGDGRPDRRRGALLPQPHPSRAGGGRLHRGGRPAGQGIGTGCSSGWRRSVGPRGSRPSRRTSWAQNSRMIGVFRGAGFELKQKFEGGAGKMTFSLDAQPLLRGAQCRALRARRGRLDEAPLRAEGRRGGRRGPRGAGRSAGSSSGTSWPRASRAALSRSTRKRRRSAA